MCPTLCDPVDGSPPGSPVTGILQARTMEWVAIAFSNAWKWKVKVKSLSRVRPPATPWTAAHQAPPSMGFSRQEYWSRVPLPSQKYFQKKNFFDSLFRKHYQKLLFCDFFLFSFFIDCLLTSSTYFFIYLSFLYLHLGPDFCYQFRMQTVTNILVFLAYIRCRIDIAIHICVNLLGPFESTEWRG